MDIRGATETDARGVAEVQVAAWKAAYRGLMPDSVLDALSVAEREEIWQRVIAQRKLQLVVAEDDRKTVGFINFGPCRDPDAVPGFAGEILAIYVAPEHWHKGIGQELLATALSGLESAGFREAILWVLDSNSRARIFYERAGFAFDGAAKSEMVADHATLRDVRYRKPL